MPEKKVEEEIQEALSINTEDLVTELKEQPSLFFYWACMWSMAARKRRLEKMKLKEVEAKLGREYKEILRAEDPKVRVSERMLDDYLAEKAEYKEALHQYAQNEYTETMLEVAKDGFKQRAQMLNELSRSHSEDRVYGNEFKVMEAELVRRDEKTIQRRNKRKQETDTTTQNT